MSTDRVDRRWGLLAFGLIWALTSLYVLRHFYELGGMRDSLWFAGLAHHGDLAMSDPPSVAFAQGASFFHTHFSPVFYLPSALSYLTPLPPAAWYALWYGLMHGLLALSFHALIAPLMRMSGLPAASAIGATLACLFALNGNAMMALQMPHYEMLIPALTVGVLALATQGRVTAALLLLAVTILVREDAGLHVAALLLPAWAWQRFMPPGQAHVALTSRIGRLGWLSLAGAILCLLIQKLGWGDNGMLVRNYLGQPLLAHLSAELLQARWANLLHERSYLWLPFLICAAWAMAERRALILWGCLACLPWLALQFVAKEEVMGSLSWYYAFPAITSLAWPMVALRVHGAPSQAQARRAVWWMGALLISTLFGRVNGQYMVYPWQIMQQLNNPLPVVQADEGFMRVLTQRSASLGKLRLDNGVIALRPRNFTATQRAEVPHIDEQAIDTLIWFDPGGFDSRCWALADRRGLRYRFAVPGSPIVIASRFDLLQDQAWQPVLTRTDLFARRTRTPLPPSAQQGGLHIGPNTPASVVAQAPRLRRTDGLYALDSVSLAPGPYLLEAHIRLEDVGDDAQALFTLRRQHEWAPELNEELVVTRDKLEAMGGQRYRLTWPLTMPTRAADAYWAGIGQIEWLHAGHGRYTIKHWSLQAVRDQQGVGAPGQ